MRKRRGLWSAAAALGMGSTAFGVAYTWTNGGTGSAWDTVNNWTYNICAETPCYPRTTNDDATIDDDCNPCTIDLSDEEIDDLTLDSVEVTFDGEGTATTLVVDMFNAGDANNATKLTLTGRAILTNVSP